MDAPKRTNPAGSPETHSLLDTDSRNRLCNRAAASSISSAGHSSQAGQSRREGRKVLNGRSSYQILSGEIHYARVPREYWRDRLKKANAMGLNTISVYVFWNLHEPKPGVYDFTGNLDVAEFVRIAQEEGLNVLLRPGPYACAEWELGGYPAWLIEDPGMVLRSNAPQYMEAVKRWMARLGKELAPLQSGRGGPIVGVQLENEYGSFGSDKVYLANLRNIYFTSALMYTVDGMSSCQKERYLDCWQWETSVWAMRKITLRS